MSLNRIQIENFRGIERLDMELGAMTVLIAENNHGKTSVFDALGLCLGLRGVTADTLFRENDFRASRDGSRARIRIVLSFSDSEDTSPGSGDERSDSGAHSPEAEERHVEFRGDPRDRRVVRRFVDAAGKPLDPQPDEAVLARLQDRHPVLLLRFAQPLPGRRPDPSDITAGREHEIEGNEKRGKRALTDTIARVYQDLAHTRGPVSADRISKGMEAAYRLLAERSVDVPPGAPLQQMLDELGSEMRRWSRPQPVDSVLSLSGSGSHNLALLLVLGSILDVRGGEDLPSNASPIIAIEEPEAHLHPILLASTWDVIRALRAQTVVTTNSGELLSSVPMACLRRLVRVESRIDVHRLGAKSLLESELRRVAYHVRAKRGGVLFARCWMLVEGESEFWLMSQLAEVLGYDLESEGVRSIEFAQCGVKPLVKLANDLGIRWHLFVDGDESGRIYARDAAALLKGAPAARRISQLKHRDIEQCLWHGGFESVYREAARIVERPDRRGPPPGRIIGKAVRRKSKPYLALAVAEAAAARGPRSIPRVIRSAIEASIALARDAMDATEE